MRDPQRQRLYDAEDVAWKDIGTDTFESLDEMLDWVNKILMYKRITNTYNKWINEDVIVVEVRNKRLQGSIGDDVGIRIHPDRMTTGEVLHELAHTIHFRILLDEGRDAPHHGSEFATIYLDLVRKTLGLKAYNALREMFDVYEVDFEAAR
jgi:hypothetical protein